MGRNASKCELAGVYFKPTLNLVLSSVASSTEFSIDYSQAVHCWEQVSGDANGAVHSYCLAGWM